MIRMALRTMSSEWLKNLQVIARSGKLLVREFVKNLIVVELIWRASDFKKEMKQSTNSSS